MVALAQPGVGVRAARAVAHRRERDLAPARCRASPPRASSAPPAAPRASSAIAAATAIAGRRTNGAPEAGGARRSPARRRAAAAAVGGLPLLGPERAQLRGHVAQLGRDVVVAAGHAPSASIISRRRVRPRTIRALTVPIGMPVAALISLWLSSS